MIFNSYSFLLIFLPLFLLGIVILQQLPNRSRMFAFVVGMSSLFYALSSVGHLMIFWASIILNWLWVTYVPLNKKNLTLGVMGNLAVLFCFKYAAFLTTEINRIGIFSSFSIPTFSYGLPLAISFYTFHQISFLVDAAKDKHPKPDLLSYAAYVTFFPQLVAGPIVRFREIADQLNRPVPFKITFPKLRIGLSFIVLGLIKKVLIADTLSEFADQGFAMTDSLTFLEAWVTLISFGLQIYFDFSAYSEIAYGLGWCVGIRLPLNFDRPYLAMDVSAFWRRWHMTLSRFLRDYLYIPLGGNREGIIKTTRNLFIVMGLGGLWHGASWNFLIWGLLQGLYLLINHAWRLISPFRLPKGLAWGLTFLSIMLAWVPFRAKSFIEMKQMFRALFNIKSIVLPENLYEITHHLGLTDYFVFKTSPVLSVFSILMVFAFLNITLFMPSVRMVSSVVSRSKYGALILGGLFSGVMIMLWERPNVFLYFNF